MGILGFTILSLGLVFFIKILTEIGMGMIKEYNDNNSIGSERKKDAIVFTMGLVLTMVILFSSDGLTQEETGIVSILFTPVIYYIYKTIRTVSSYFMNRQTKVYELKDKAKGWKVVPYGGKRVSEFTNKSEFEIYRIHTLIKNVLSNNYGYVIDAENYKSISVKGEDLEITLEVVSESLRRKNRIALLKNKLKKEGRFYVLLKKELLPYTYMIDGSSLKLGDNTLIARVDYCDIKVNIKRSA